MSENRNDIAIPGVIPENYNIHHENLVDDSTRFGEWARSLSCSQAQSLRDEARNLLRSNAKVFERATRNPIHSTAVQSALDSGNSAALIELFKTLK